MTGLCAYALAFSTLLSSQGADAHRHKAFAWFGGNPLSLPASSRAVKRLHLTLTTSQPHVPPAYPAVNCPDGRTAHRREFPGWPPAPGAFRRPRSRLAAGRNIRHTSHPRQIERPCTALSQVSALPETPPHLGHHQPPLGRVPWPHA